MEADPGDVAELKVRFARRGSVRAASVLGGLLIVASPFVDAWMNRDGAPTPNVVGAEMEPRQYDIEWAKMTLVMRAECAERPHDRALREACAQIAEAAVEHCDQECRTWGTELAAHVSFGY